MPWESQAKGSQRRKKTKKGRKAKAAGDGVDNPLLSDDLDFESALVDEGMDLEDENVDVEGAMDDLESALDAAGSSGPKWHKTTCATFEVEPDIINQMTAFANRNLCLHGVTLLIPPWLCILFFVRAATFNYQLWARAARKRESEGSDREAPATDQRRQEQRLEPLWCSEARGRCSSM